ncbi:hypothetical protein AX16_007055 [Volvariella volvacea WC 439]|nr:hypothetical protein AX16_007055 [Volvariella volvacea WC 439]
MLFFTLTALLASAILTTATPGTLMYSNGHRPDCGTTISQEHLRNVERVFRTFHPPPSLFRDPDDDPAVIPVYWHIIAADRTLEGGWLPRQQIAEQMKVLNQDFAETGLVFQHIATFRVIQPQWFTSILNTTDLEMKMKKRLRRGGPETLNIYTLQISILGRAAFPADYDSDPFRDGIMLNYGTLPGGFLEPFNLGRTLTHEVGHWVGLYHTFEGGCDGGDQVSDTPAEGEKGFGCPIGRDSCPEHPGLDPIENFMDYGDDYCLTHFTPGQIQRLQNQMRSYRGVAV